MLFTILICVYIIRMKHNWVWVHAKKYFSTANAIMSLLVLTPTTENIIYQYADVPRRTKWIVAVLYLRLVKYQVLVTSLEQMLSLVKWKFLAISLEQMLSWFTFDNLHPKNKAPLNISRKQPCEFIGTVRSDLWTPLKYSLFNPVCTWLFWKKMCIAF